MTTYRRKPVPVEVWPVRDGIIPAAWQSGAKSMHPLRGSLFWKIVDEVHVTYAGYSDYIIRDPDGTLSVLTPEEFEKQIERVE